MHYITEYKNDRGGWTTDGQSKSLDRELDRRREFLLRDVSAQVFDLDGFLYTEEDRENGTQDSFKARRLSAYKSKHRKKKNYH